MQAFKPLDPAQREASEALLALHQELLATKADPPARGLWSQMRSKITGPSRPIPGVYLWGGVGRGKTYLMDWFVNDLKLPGKRRVHFHHFMREIHGVMSGLPKQPDPLEVVADRLRAEVRVLCLDEFLVTDITDAMLLHGLLRALFLRGTTLVTTANTPPDELYRNGLQRQSFLPAIDLLKQHTRIMELDGGTDYRLRALSREGVLFDATADGERHLADYFQRLTGGHQLPEREIQVNGRSLPVRGLGMDIIWLDFATLCGTPRSAADYIELAKEYHSILVSGVPALGPRHEAAARRFLHLVDELYDQRVKLVLSAEAPIDGLYLGGLQEFAHERLLSRLVEMQSTEYLAAAVPEG
ncbi:cell division protein ZapE [Thiorhodococcus minor]|uniref:cell division protein ZapE n=1 Tax=Thiorhodococcus minor TaxID=57489 RepID=UPI001FD73195|nr:cell division protein ZapE [Thiorhodococcus minor]